MKKIVFSNKATSLDATTVEKILIGTIQLKMLKINRTWSFNCKTIGRVKWWNYNRKIYKK